MISCVPDPGEEMDLNGTIVGKVSNSLTGDPIAAATVSLSGLETKSEIIGSDGLYRFENLVAGTYTIAASHVDYDENSVEISLQPEEVAEGDLALTPIAPIAVNPSILDFSTAIATLEVSITNTSSRVINYEIQSLGNWLAANRTQGVLQSQNVDLISVSVDRTRLDVGSHEGNLVFNVPGLGSKKLQILATKLDATSAVMVLDNGVLDFGKSLDSRILKITNEGDNTLIWNLDVSDSWISSNAIDGSLPPDNEQTVTINVDRNEFADGDYNGQVAITSNGGNANVSIKMEVNSSTGGSGGTVVTPGLRAYYTFEDGTAKDQMDNFQAVSFGPESSTDSPVENGKSFEFDGVDDFLQLSGNPLLNTNSRTIHGTVSSWIKTSSNGAICSIPIAGSDQENEWLAGISGGKILHSISNRVSSWDWGFFNLDISSILNNGDWHHVVLAYDGSTDKVSLFIDGVKLSQEAYFIAGTLSAETSRIGGDYYDGSSDKGLGSFSGLMDNVRFYNRPLTASEVEEIFDARQ